MSKSNTWWPTAVGAVLLVGVVGAALYFGRPGPAPAPTRAVNADNPIAPEADARTPAVRFPIETAPTGEAGELDAPLPALEESDAAALESLAGLIDAEGFSDLLNPQHLIQRLVATIDNLPRAKVAPQIWPAKPVPGPFAVAQIDKQRVIDDKNAARYAPYVKIVESVDAKKLVGWYRGFYPLFQQAYRELGYPDGYFNDRLVEVIDHLLAAPEARQPLALVQPRVMYEYADPNLEAQSAGHKLMLRLGAENSAKVKAKLREVRRELTGQEHA